MFEDDLDKGSFKSFRNVGKSKQQELDQSLFSGTSEIQALAHQERE